jgi:hypothetical protein
MAHAQHRQSRERRHLADRRSHPTTFLSTLRWQGRRTGFRRAGEGHRAYVDCLARRTVVLTLCVFVGSLLDALLTLRHWHNGGGEVNPLLHLVLSHSPTLFLPLKLSLTSVGVWGLAAHQQFPLAQYGLRGLTLSYGVVLVYHLILSLRLV